MSKITESARGRSCTVRLIGVCNYNPETTVFAHISGIRFGHGTGKKTALGAFCCSSCHDVLDGRVKRSEGMCADDVKLAHYEGVMETLSILNEEGLVILE